MTLILRQTTLNWTFGWVLIATALILSDAPHLLRFFLAIAYSAAWSWLEPDNDPTP